MSFCSTCHRRNPVTLKTGLRLVNQRIPRPAWDSPGGLSQMNGLITSKPMFPCPVCTVPREVLLTKKRKPYLTCNPCGVQVFVRGPAGITEFSRLLESTSEESLLTRLNHMERQYRLTCLGCGHKFWITPTLIKTSVFDGSMKGVRCPQKGCDRIVPWNEGQK